MKNTLEHWHNRIEIQAGHFHTLVYLDASIPNGTAINKHYK